MAPKAEGSCTAKSASLFYQLQYQQGSTVNKTTVCKFIMRSYSVYSLRSTNCENFASCYSDHALRIDLLYQLCVATLKVFFLHSWPQQVRYFFVAPVCCYTACYSRHRLKPPNYLLYSIMLLTIFVAAQRVSVPLVRMTC